MGLGLLCWVFRVCIISCPMNRFSIWKLIFLFLNYLLSQWKKELNVVGMIISLCTDPDSIYYNVDLCSILSSWAIGKGPALRCLIAPERICCKEAVGCCLESSCHYYLPCKFILHSECLFMPWFPYGKPLMYCKQLAA